MFGLKRKVINVLLLTLKTILVLNFWLSYHLKDNIVVYFADPKIISFLKTFFVTPIVILLLLIDFLPFKTNAFVKSYVFATIYICVCVVFFMYGTKMVSTCEFKECVNYVDYIYYVFKQWKIGVVYAFLDIWGPIFITTNFWQLSSRISNSCVDTTSQNYQVYGLGTPIGMLLAGFVLRALSKRFSSADLIYKAIPLMSVVLSVLVLLTIIAVHRLYNSDYSNNPTDYRLINDATEKENDTSKLVRGKDRFPLIASIVALSFVINFLVCKFDMLWMLSFAKSKTDFMLNMSDFNILLGLLCLFSTFISFFIFKKLDWKGVAIYIFLISLLSTSFVYLNFLFHFSDPRTIFTIGIAAIKSIKNNIFDVLKEILYDRFRFIERRRIKTVADIIFSKLAKFASALLLSLGLAFIGDSPKLLLYISLFALPFLLISYVLWFIAIIVANRIFMRSITEKSINVDNRG